MAFTSQNRTNCFNFCSLHIIPKLIRAAQKHYMQYAIFISWNGCSNFKLSRLEITGSKWHNNPSLTFAERSQTREYLFYHIIPSERLWWSNFFMRFIFKSPELSLTFAQSFFPTQTQIIIDSKFNWNDATVKCNSIFWKYAKWDFCLKNAVLNVCPLHKLKKNGNMYLFTEKFSVRENV